MKQFGVLGRPISVSMCNERTVYKRLSAASKAYHFFFFNAGKSSLISSATGKGGEFIGLLPIKNSRFSFSIPSTPEARGLLAHAPHPRRYRPADWSHGGPRLSVRLWIIRTCSLRGARRTCRAAISGLFLSGDELPLQSDDHRPRLMDAGDHRSKLSFTWHTNNLFSSLPKSILPSFVTFR